MRIYSSGRGKARYFTSERSPERQHLYLDAQRSIMDALYFHQVFSVTLKVIVLGRWLSHIDHYNSYGLLPSFYYDWNEYRRLREGKLI